MNRRLCPFCSRTFADWPSQRAHVARKHEAELRSRRQRMNEMLGLDLKGSSYVLPDWWKGERPDPVEEKDEREERREESEHFRQTGDRD